MTKRLPAIVQDLTVPDDRWAYYTDGSCYPNPGPGGAAVVLEGSVMWQGYEHQTTNNRMEGMAILAALKYNEGAPAVIFTDSQIWLNIATRYAPIWETNGWARGPKREPVASLDLVRPIWRLFGACRENVEIRWVRGHSGVPGNELADKAAREARLIGIERTRP